MIIPFWQTTDKRTVKLYQGDVRHVLNRLRPNSVQCVVTSPPYWGLRDYQTDKNYEIGSEPKPDCETWGKAQCGKCFVCVMVDVFKGVKRVLRDDGVLWINLGDTYAQPASGGEGVFAKGRTDGRSGDGGIDKTRKAREMLKTRAKDGMKSGIKSGNLLGIPWRVALALQSDGWILRSDVPWIKRSPMPESANNRPNKALEYVFLLSKSNDYYFDMEAIKKKLSSKPHSPSNKKLDSSRNDLDRMDKVWGSESGRNFRNSDLWFSSLNAPYGLVGMEEDGELVGLDVTSQGYPGAHYACVDDKTEALTRQGWKNHTNLVDGEEIAAYDSISKNIVWQPATFHRYDFDGEMVSIEKVSTSQLLTPNHRCLVLIRTRDGKKERVCRAENLNSRMDLFVSSEWKQKGGKSIGEALAELCGWYVAEGTKKSGRRVIISQSISANPEKVKRIRSLLKSINADFKERIHKTRLFRGKESICMDFIVKGKVAQQMRDVCKNRNITDWCYNLIDIECEAMLRGLIDGDGHRRKDGRICIIQKGRENIDRIQILALRCGYRALIKPRQELDMYTLWLTRGKHLTIRSTNAQSIDKEWVKYKGVVWCPSVESTFWLARRNGMPFITGNTFPPKLVEPLILSSTGAKGCCAECGKCWKRIVKKVTDNQHKGDTGYKRDRSFRESRNGVDSTLDTGANEYETVGWKADCKCGDVGSVQCVVLDPFIGSGTVAEVCLQHRRRCVGIDLSDKYLEKNAVPRVCKAIQRYRLKDIDLLLD